MSTSKLTHSAVQLHDPLLRPLKIERLSLFLNNTFNVTEPKKFMMVSVTPWKFRFFFYRCTLVLAYIKWEVLFIRIFNECTLSVLEKVPYVVGLRTSLLLGNYPQQLYLRSGHLCFLFLSRFHEILCILHLRAEQYCFCNSESHSGHIANICPWMKRWESSPVCRR